MANSEGFACGQSFGFHMVLYLCDELGSLHLQGHNFKQFCYLTK